MPEAPAAAPMPMPMPIKSGGVVSAYFPSGRAEGSGLLVQKMAPAQAFVGQPYQYSYKVCNLTEATLENVKLMDRVSSDFTPSDSEPKAAGMSGGNATWDLGTFGPKECKTVTVNGSSPDEGIVTTCGWATYNPVACQQIQILKAGIALTKSEPADGTVCDPIPVTLVVKNTGSSALSGVQVADSLPAGMTSDGKSSLNYNVGNLAPGESKEIKYNAAVSGTGKYENNAKATAAEGVSATASATTTVHQPVLTIACKADETQVMTRPFDVCYTVSNTGDAPAAGSTLVVNVPSGLSARSATGNGSISGSTITYDLGTIAPGGSEKVCATFVSGTSGTFAFAGAAKGACAAPVSSSCETRVTGIPAILLEKADDPDPVAIGETTTYTVKVTNQGSADDHNVEVVVTIAPELAPVSGDGTIDGQTVTMPVVPTLAPKQAVTYRIVAKGVSAGDGHTLFKLNSDVLKAPISAQESTHVY
jgi:uncharacterized repeat protein (TIGR01451 family)